MADTLSLALVVSSIFFCDVMTQSYDITTATRDAHEEHVSFLLIDVVSNQKHIMTRVEYLANNTHNIIIWFCFSQFVLLGLNVFFFSLIAFDLPFHFDFFYLLLVSFCDAVRFHNRLGRWRLGCLKWLDTVLDDMRWRHQEPLPRMRFAATEVWRQVLRGKCYPFSSSSSSFKILIYVYPHGRCNICSISTGKSSVLLG